MLPIRPPRHPFAGALSEPSKRSGHQSPGETSIGTRRDASTGTTPLPEAGTANGAGDTPPHVPARIGRMIATHSGERQPFALVSALWIGTPEPRAGRVGSAGQRRAAPGRQRSQKLM